MNKHRQKNNYWRNSFLNSSDSVASSEPEEAIVLLSIHDGMWEKPLVREIRLVVEGENWSNDVLTKGQREGVDKSKGEMQTTWLENGYAEGNRGDGQ